MERIPVTRCTIVNIQLSCTENGSYDMITD